MTVFSEDVFFLQKTCRKPFSSYISCFFFSQHLSPMSSSLNSSTLSLKYPPRRSSSSSSSNADTHLIVHFCNIYHSHLLPIPHCFNDALTYLIISVENFGCFSTFFFVFFSIALKLLIYFSENIFKCIKFNSSSSSSRVAPFFITYLFTYYQFSHTLGFIIFTHSSGFSKTTSL